MSITRRSFIKLGSAAAFAVFLVPVSATGQEIIHNSAAIPTELFDDPLYYLTAQDFQAQIGTEFLLFTETGAITAVLSDVTQSDLVMSDTRITRGVRNRFVSENFTLSFTLPTEEFTQATYRLQHSSLGEFDLFLVPEANGNFLLHAVINRI